MNRMVGVLALIGLIQYSVAQQSNNAFVDSLKPQDTRIEVIHNTKDGLYSDTPGTISIVFEKEFQRSNSTNIGDVLRKRSGLNVIDEDPAGLRSNISSRGLNPLRSSDMLILEDGIPVAVNPYGEPTLCLSPMVDVMNQIDILKNAGQLEFGPHSIGGIINFKTFNPTLHPKNNIRFNVARDGFLMGSFTHSNTINDVGFLANVTHKRADNLGSLTFNLTNIMGKATLKVGAKSNLNIKLSYYNERSNATNLGITQAMFDNNDNLHTALSPNDLMLLKRISIAGVHTCQIVPKIRLQTIVYTYDIKRDWRVQLFTRDGMDPHANGVVWGNPDLTDGSAIFMSNRANWRNRHYQVGSIESKLMVNFKALGTQNQVKIGARFHKERVQEQFLQLERPDVWTGTIRDNEVREGKALSFFALNKTHFSDKLSMEYGFRIEDYDYQRKIYRGRFNIDGNIQVRDTLVLYWNYAFSAVPGIGINYTPSSKGTLFFSFNKGYSPPQTKTSITPNGIANNIDEEQSLNCELGGRFALTRYFRLYATLFYIDFKNQIIPVNVNVNPTGVANGGATLHKGIEFGTSLDISQIINSKQQLTIGFNCTYLQARFTGYNVVKKSLPYSPELMVNPFVIAQFRNKFGFSIFGNFVSEQFNDRNNRVRPTADGLVGIIPSRFIIDTSVYYELEGLGVRLTLSVKNLTNQKYIASRNPQGIRVGLDRFITAGLDFTL
ncbi:MAG: TonB-dependent receptor [Bacteroidota bacterium]|nr:TonB-dependent receptor [Bacteroidota bacterium]